MHALLTIVAGQGSPKTFELDPARQITIGRSRDNTIVLQDERASRLHANVYFDNGQWMLSDNHTLNGTRIGTSLVDKPVPLRDGLEFDIADTRLRFTVPEDGAAETALAPAG